jgi:hypothetical protein
MVCELSKCDLVVICHGGDLKNERKNVIAEITVKAMFAEIEMKANGFK